MKSITEQIQFTQEDQSFIKHFKDEIIDRWSQCPAISGLKAQFDIGDEEFKFEVATPVVNYFVTIIDGENQPGDCPVMRRVVDKFYAKGFNVEDVFVNCTMFKNVLHQIMRREKMSEETFYHLTMTLDHNLREILAIYTKMLKEKQKMTQKQNEIIQDQVLMSVCDLEGKILEVTDAFCELMGYSKEELLGHKHNMIKSTSTAETTYKELWDTISNKKEWRGTLTNLTHSGEERIQQVTIIPVLDDDGEILEYMSLSQDLTDIHGTYFDTLTKVYNRKKFDETFESLIEYCHSNGEELSMLIVDVDNFKAINDRYGHQVGDQVLVDISNTLMGSIRSNDILARWGGEEFVVLLPKTPIDIAQQIAERMRQFIESEIVVEGEPQSASFGLSSLQEGDCKKSFFARVDSAMYEAKKSGKNCVVSHG
jgi:diguanylate cyclase (GGDEF)-like protein/PAS domain S-box-containing protein